MRMKQNEDELGLGVDLSGGGGAKVAIDFARACSEPSKGLRLPLKLRGHLQQVSPLDDTERRAWRDVQQAANLAPLGWDTPDKAAGGQGINQTGAAGEGGNGDLT